jgi:hypothetical protein
MIYRGLARRRVGRTVSLQVDVHLRETRQEAQLPEEEIEAWLNGLLQEQTPEWGLAVAGVPHGVGLSDEELADLLGIDRGAVVEAFNNDGVRRYAALAKIYFEDCDDNVADERKVRLMQILCDALMP